MSNWIEKKRHERGRRALERQLDYQQKKAAGFADHEADLAKTNFLHAQGVRCKIEGVRPLLGTDRVLEVGSGSHGIVFGLGGGFAIGVDPLAVHYKQLFPKLQAGSQTVAAIGEELPFADAAFEIVLSDNVIDHAERPLKIVDETVRVLKPGGLLYFTVNVHHPLYHLASRAHGAWNALGLKVELSAFADHTVHFTEKRIADVFTRLPLKILSQTSTVAATRQAQRSAPVSNADSILKKLFFKNAIYEVLAQKHF